MSPDALRSPAETPIRRCSLSDLKLSRTEEESLIGRASGISPDTAGIFLLRASASPFRFLTRSSTTAPRPSSSRRASVGFLGRKPFHPRPESATGGIASLLTLFQRATISPPNLLLYSDTIFDLDQRNATPDQTAEYHFFRYIRPLTLGHKHAQRGPKQRQMVFPVEVATI